MPDSTVPSPCTNVCRMDARGRCEGCLRTIDEIAGWSTMSDAEKHQVWGELALRQREGAAFREP
jgi:uncharacterized protein